MTLQASGAISLLDIQNEFGGSNPIGINEYYGSGGAPSSGTISIGNFYGRSASSGSLSITLLLMAGGGSAESDEEDPRAPGGGGAGGLLTQTLSVAGSNAITIGGSDGNSTFPSATTAIKGGYTFSGGESRGFAANGGSGGGWSGGGRGAGPPGDGTPGQGNPGTYSGGGGGKGSAGAASGGGGGSGYNIADFRGGPALTVAFGGPAGSYFPTQSPAANTGGGATRGEASGGGTTPGGSGIVIVRYPGSTQLATGGNSTYTRTVGGVAYYFHEFTSSGTFTKT